MRAQHRLADGRLHLQDGPIDLIIEAFGAPAAVARAYSAASVRFATALDELCRELALLRTPVRRDSLWPSGPIARRQFEAAARLCERAFITPMAAVAGAVADEILAAMTGAASLTRAYVNNGGDIALHLAKGERFCIAMIERPDSLATFGRIALEAAGPVRGVATSGWRGRSFSLGIADAVTVLAAGAAAADAAATLIANAVDLPGHPAIVRTPARALDPQSDLADRRVTRGVGPLTRQEVNAALGAGWREAEAMRTDGSIMAAALHLQGETHVSGASAFLPTEIENGKIPRREAKEQRHAIG